MFVMMEVWGSYLDLGKVDTGYHPFVISEMRNNQ